MTGNELIQLYRTLTDDTSVPDSVVLQWLNQADTIIRGRRAWEFAKKLQTIPVSGTSYALNSDFFAPITLGIDGRPYQGLRIDDIASDQYQSGYWIDRTTDPFTLNFVESQLVGSTIKLVYKFKPAAFTATTSPQAAYADYHHVLAYVAATQQFFNDQDRALVGFQDRLRQQEKEIYDSMVAWDTDNFLINRSYGKNVQSYLLNADSYAPNR